MRNTDVVIRYHVTYLVNNCTHLGREEENENAFVVIVFVDESLSFGNGRRTVEAQVAVTAMLQIHLDDVHQHRELWEHAERGSSR